MAAELLMFHNGRVECSLDVIARLGCGLKTGSPFALEYQLKQSITGKSSPATSCISGNVKWSLMAETNDCFHYIFILNGFFLTFC